jgi:hypothetical protein
MKFSARGAARKWPCGRFGCDQRPSAVLVAVLLLTMWVAPASARSTIGAVPLPQPRPAEAPAIEDKPSEHKPAGAEKPASEAPPPPSACRLALTESIAIAPSIPSISGPGDCGGDDLVRLEAVVLPDNKGRVAVNPAAVLRCTMASAIADWIRTDMAPLAEGQGSRLRGLDNLGSYECRGRDGVVGAKLSEHGHANALDVQAFKLASGASIALTDRTVPRDVRETVLHSACARFTTVLGPGSDGYHEDHIHLDLLERHNGYRICQWEVWDPLPQVAPLLPAERPEEAPPREVAEKADAKPSTTPTPRPLEAAAAPKAAAESAAPLLPAERPKEAPPREVAEKADARRATTATPAPTPSEVAAAPKAAAEGAGPPEPDQPKLQPKPRPKPKPRLHRRRRMPGLFDLFRLR